MKERSRNVIAALFVAAGAGFIALGAHLGEVKVVLQKAVTICLECIGIG